MILTVELHCFSQRRIYEAYLNSELVLSAFYDSPLAALTVIYDVEGHAILLCYVLLYYFPLSNTIFYFLYLK